MKDKKTLIITSHIERPERLTLDSGIFHSIICADGGYAMAKKMSITPDTLIGDYDSMKKPERDDLILLPIEKDMTDTEAALDLAYSRGMRDITILGGLGGRFDHTMGNIGLLRKYLGRAKITLLDGQNAVTMVLPGKYPLPKDDHHYLGLIACSAEVAGLTISGVKYPLSGYTLTPDTTLGVSNEIISSSAELTFRSGILLIIRSND